MKQGIWMSYDLGVGGDYDNLYSWLDDHGAKECGDSIAYLKYEITDEDKFISKIKKELKDKIDLRPTNRIYIIRRVKNEDGSHNIVGTFLFGKRKANPWEGFGEKATNHPDTDE